MFDNPYEILYRRMDFHKMSAALSRDKATECIKHLGLMYNTFGEAIKDLVKIVAVVLPAKSNQIVAVPQQQPQFVKGKLNKRRPCDLFTLKPKTNGLKQRVHQVIMEQKTAIKSQAACTLKEGNQLLEQQCKEIKQSLPSQYINSNSLEQSDPSLFQKKQETVMSKAQIIHNISVFNSQLQCDKSPEKPSLFQTEQIKAEIYTLSHKQRFVDPSQYILQQDDQYIMPHSDLLQTTSGSQAISNQPNQKLAEPIENNHILAVPKENECMRIAGKRKKKEREKLTGMSCVQCQKYYKLMQIKTDRLCECTSRHRSNAPVRKYKNNFTQQFDGF